MTAQEVSPPPTAGDYDSRLTELDARIATTAFVREQSYLTECRLGFGWVGTPQAPSTYLQLRAAWAESQATGRPLPASSENLEPSLFLDGEANLAFRFWHDVSHVEHGLSFALADELELALWQLEQARAAGIAPDSAAYRLLEADSLGQVYLDGLLGRFPFDQLAFTRVCLASGLGSGLAEARRLPLSESAN